MQRLVIVVLAAVFVAVLPVWPFDRHWSYGPAIAVGFLLAVNLLMLVSERTGRGRDER
jgi:hypothetical protein